MPFLEKIDHPQALRVVLESSVLDHESRERLLPRMPERGVSEIVAEGFDPRSPVLADTVELGKGQTLTRVVVYQRNFERLVADPAMVDSALESLLGEELGRAFES